MSIDSPSAVRWRGSVQRGLLDSVVEEIGYRVVSGRYGVGENIPTEPVLMAEMEISRTVLREALKILIAKGLLESRPKVGTRVKSKRSWNMLDPTILRLYCRVADYSDFAEQFQQLRFMIEPQAAALAATNRSEEQHQAIATAYEAMANAQTLREWTEADLGFHQTILEATGNPFVMPLGSLIHTALETLLYQSASSSPDPFASLQGHHRVLVAIGDRDAAAAHAAMRDLLGNTSLAVSHAIEAGLPPSNDRPSKEPRWIPS
jgi:DNA-binding FadR family transcriptional regulator